MTNTRSDSLDLAQVAGHLQYAVHAATAHHSDLQGTRLERAIDAASARQADHIARLHAASTAWLTDHMRAVTASGAALTNALHTAHTSSTDAEELQSLRRFKAEHREDQMTTMIKNNQELTVENYTLVSRLHRAEAQLVALQHSLTEAREHLGHALEAERMLRLEVDGLRALLSPGLQAPSDELLL